VLVPFTWKVTGWFMVGWSPEFPVGEVRPLHYFGDDLVAYRDEHGELHVLEAHCKHLGAHIGHGGKVVGDCVQCPFHGWRWGPDGGNRYIPYQPDRPNRALRLRVFPPDGVTMEGLFTRSHVGGNNAVHGGMIPLLYDWHFGMIVSTAGLSPSRTAYLHVDYRNITPIDEPLTAYGRIAEIDGRKAFVTATMTAADGTLLSEANGLMVRLLPHQP
jgi:nitrite reductase/ring-hydroxylating ferredoxin subunit